MGIKNNKNATLVLVILISLLKQLPVESNSINEIQVGIILDMGSLLGKTLHTCIAMAISDFYAVKSVHRTTRIVLHIKDSKGDPMLALSAANELLLKNNVQAIIGPQTFLEANFLAVISNKAKVPIFSFTASTPSFDQYPYLVQIGQDVPSQFEAIASLVQTFKWKNVVFIYEDTDYSRYLLPNILKSFLDKNIQIDYSTPISLLATDDQILEQLFKLMTLQTTVFVVHLSPSLASRFFIHARTLRMVSKGYVWILTDNTLKVLHTRDADVIKSLKGALGVKPYIPQSENLLKFNLRLRNKHYSGVVKMGKFRVPGLLAYDGAWALANGIERVGLNLTGLGSSGTSKNGKALLNEISRNKFMGVSGEYQIMNQKLITDAFEIVNVMKTRGQGVGFWTRTRGIKLSSSDLDKIVWPGMSKVVPKGFFMRTSRKKLRIAVPQKMHFKELISMNYDNRTGDLIVTGFCIDVFKAAVEALPYEVDYEFIPFLGTYDDLISQVYFQKYDAAVGDISITANRSQYVDFTSSYTDLGVATIAKTENKDMWIFLKPLDANLWLTSLAFFLITGFVVWLIEHPSNLEFQGTRAQQIATILWFSFSTLVYAHREKLTSNWSKFVVTVWVFVVLILTSSYTATLASNLTVQQIQRVSKGDHIGFHTDTPFTVKPTFYNLYYEDYKLWPYLSPEEYADALSRGKKNGGATVIIDEIPYVKIFLAKYSSEYVMVQTQSTTNGFGFVFQKGDPLVPELSREIAQLREERKLLMLEKNWFNRQQSNLGIEDGSVAKPKTLNLGNFWGLFIVTGFSSTSAVLWFLIYFLYQKLGINNYLFRLMGSGGFVPIIARYIFARNKIAVEELSGIVPQQ